MPGCSWLIPEAFGMSSHLPPIPRFGEDSPRTFPRRASSAAAYGLRFLVANGVMADVEIVCGILEAGSTYLGSGNNDDITM